MTGLPATHAGIDFAGVPEGAPIYTPRAGTVTFAGPKGAYGNLVIIKNDDGTEARYAHNKQILVKAGDRVEADTAVSEMGSTGKSTGPHLHLELRDKDQKLIDPTAFFEDMQKAPVRNARRLAEREAQAEERAASAQLVEFGGIRIPAESPLQSKSRELETKPFLVESASRQLFPKAAEFIDEQRRLLKEGAVDLADIGSVIGLASQAQFEKGETPPLGSTVGLTAGRLLYSGLAEKPAAEALTEKVAELRAKQAAKFEAARKKTDIESARLLADNLLKEETRPASPAKAFVERRTAELLRKRSPEQMTSGPAFDAAQEEAKEQARAELVQLYTEGGAYAPFVPADLLRGDPTWADENLPKALVDTYRAMGLRREVLPSGKIARVESVPGWVFNAALSIPSVVATTAIQNFTDAEEEWANQSFADNLAARRDTVSYRIERDDKLQADLFSGDPDRTTDAVTTLLPWMALEMIAIPDTVTAARWLGAAAAKAPSTAAATLALSKEAPRIAREVAKATDKTGTLKAETKKVFAELEKQDAARQAAKEAAKKAKAAETVDKAFSFFRGELQASGSVSDALASLDREGGLARSLAVRMRDEIKARMVADPEIEAFLRSVEAENTPLERGMDSLPVQRRDLPDEELALAEAGRAKFADALDVAERAVVEDTRTRLLGATAPAVTRADVAPLPPLEASEIERVFGSANVSPERARRVADARTLDTLLDTLSSSPEEVRVAVAKRLGAQSYEDLRRLAAVDVDALEDVIAIARNDLQVARSAARVAQDNYDAAVATPALMKQYADTRAAAVVADKELRAAEAAADSVRTGTRDSVRAFSRAAQEYEKRAKQPEPVFTPSKKVQREGERITAMQDAIAERASSRKLEQLQNEKTRLSDSATAEVLAQQGRIRRTDEAAAKLAAERRTIENSKTSQKDRDRRLEKLDEKQTKLDEKIRIEAKTHQDRMLGYDRGLAAKAREIEAEKASIRFRNEAELSELRKQREQLAVQTREEFRIYQEKMSTFLKERDLSKAEMQDLQRAMDADIKKVEADLAAAQQKAAISSKAAAVTPRPVGRRRLAQVSDTAKAHFAFAGYPVYARGYTGRPPMKYTTGKQAHLLHRALLRDHGPDAALGSYVSGPETRDFTQRAARIPHVGVPLRHYETPRAASEFYRQRVQTPNGPRAYDPSPDVRGLPAQRALPTSVEYTDLGKEYWAWADSVAERNPKLPRARSNNEYYHSLLAWSDPYSKPADVDLIRLRDQVFVADARKASEVGPLKQPNAVRNAQIVETTREGFTGIVLGFGRGADGRPVVRVQPMEWSGSAFVPAKRAVDVDPASLMYMERGRKRTVLEDGRERIRPYTDADWASIRALEDAQPGARSLRYSNDDLFMELAPPERPTPRDFNYNPDNKDIERLFTPDELAAIKRDMGEDARPLAGIKEGFEGDLQRQRLADELNKRISAAAAAEQRVRDLSALPAERARLDRALSAVSAENADVAQRMGLYAQAKERRPLGAEILPERPGGEAFVAELEQLDEVITAVNRNTVLQKTTAMRESVADFFRPADELAQKSLLPVVRDIRKKFLGEMRLVSAELAKAAGPTDVKRGSRGNIKALQLIEDDVPVFGRSLREGTIANRGLIDVVAFAYVRDPQRAIASINPDTVARLRQVVANWAAAGSDNMLGLRNELLKVTRDNVGAEYLREPSEGDVILAYPIALNAAWDRVVNDMQVAGLARTKDQAQAASEYVAGLLDVGIPLGGRARAVEGQRVLAELLVPTQYRAPIRKVSDIAATRLPEVAQTPLVPARQKTTVGRVPSVARTEAVDDVVALLEQTAEVMDGEVYVPRQLREALAQQMGKVLATVNAQGPGVLSARYWAQGLVVGFLSSRPNQFLMDTYGDIGQVTAAGHPWAAARAAIRSGMAQALGIPGVAQGTYLTEALLRAARQGKTSSLTEPGGIARAYVAYTGFSPGVTAIIEGRRGYKLFGEDAADVRLAAREAGVFESFYAGQLSATLASRSRELYGGALSRRIAALFEGNQRALRDMVDQAATRRRVAIMYSFMEDGLSSKQAAQKTAQIVGDFAGELHPLEQNVVSLLMPFWSYRKYAARRILRNLTSPFWMTRFVKGEEYAGDILSAYMDDSDEFGFHTDSMATEFDPQALYALYMEYPGDDKDSDEASVWVREQAVQRNAPRAIERYERLVAKLRKDSEEKGRAQTLIDMKSDPDFLVLQAYYAPDPVKDMLPLWAQDRVAVFDNERRSQATASWYNALVPRGEAVEQPRKDTIRFSLLPSNPFHSALADVAAVLATGSLVDQVGRMLVGATHPGDEALAGSVFSGFVENPAVRLGARLTMGVDLAAEQDAAGVYLGPVMGPILYRMNLADMEVTTLPTGREVAGAAVDPNVLFQASGQAEARYVLAPQVRDAAMVVPPIAEVVFGALDIEGVLLAMGGESAKPMVDSVTNRTYNALNGAFGFKTFRISPSMQEKMALQKAEERVRTLTRGMPSPRMLPTPPDVEAARTISRVEEAGEPEVTQQMLADAVRRIQAKQQAGAQDWVAYQVLLARLGMTPAQIGALTPEEQRGAVIEAVRDPRRRADVAQALAATPVTR